MNSKLTLLLLFLLFTNQFFAQISVTNTATESTISPSKNFSDKHHCGTPPPTEDTRRYIRENIIAHEVQRKATRNNVNNCLPVKVHIVRETGGSGGLSEGNLAIAFANLNYVFYEADIEFFVCDGINYIDDSDFYNFSQVPGDDDVESTFTAPHQVTDAINVFFMNSITFYNPTSMTTTPNIAGFARFPFNGASSNRIFMINSIATNSPNSTFSHEMGHYFGLYHTHAGTEFGNGNANAERVTRNAPNANCSTNGDELCDTDADPRYNGQFNFSTCTYTGGAMDDLGDTYLPTTAINNIMSYYPDQCGGIFTPGQFTRMGSALIQRQGYSAYDYSCTSTAVTPATGMTATQNGNQIDLSWTDNANNELGYIIERSSTSSSSGFSPVIYGGVGSGVETFSDTETASSNTTYWYRVRPINSSCANASYSNVASVTTGLIYCTPSYSDGCTNAFLQNFTMNGNGGSNEINNINSGCSGGYADHTNLSATVTAGSNYSFTAVRSSGFTRFIEVWADWNQDGDFEDSGEQMINASHTLNYTGSLAVPATATNGTTVMRVIVASNAAPSAPCGSYIFGETEDYSLLVTGGILPITLTSFSGKNQEESVLLSWETASEFDNDFFTLERSRDGTRFEKIAIVNGAGTSETTNYYNHPDSNPSEGVNYYRLKQTDFDGTFSYSNIIVVKVKVGENVSANVIPNPVQRDEFTLLYHAVKQGKLQVQIMDVTGKKVNWQNWQVEEGKNSFAIDISKLKAGIYFLQTHQNNSIKTIRFVRL